MGVVFLCIIVACFFGVTTYLATIYFHYEPYTMKSLMAGPQVALDLWSIDSYLV
jgi:MFS transporter, DHA1 family, multidrug resistance protein